MKYNCTYLLLLFVASVAHSQVTLNANGPGNTYELINSVLAPGADAVEPPDCGHTNFGRHIDEVFDNDLNQNVFRFTIHSAIDNDRCENFDRQRNEIKTYDKSPENLKGRFGEIFQYKWRFKLPSGFKSSSNFTHIHQLKSVGGLLEDMPMYTITTRKGNPDRLELRYAATDTQVTLTDTPLSPFLNTWVEVTETIKYATAGTYSIVIKKVSDNSTLLNYSNSNIINWRNGGAFVRPKWGIYRSLLNVADLRDEQLLFNGFSIQENPTLNTQEFEKIKPQAIYNERSNGIEIINLNQEFNEIKLLFIDGKQLDRMEIKSLDSIKISTNTLSSGIYMLQIIGNLRNEIIKIAIL